MDVSVWLGTVAALLAATWRTSTPLIYAGLGETFTERAGVLNIGLEGIMLFGALAAYLTALDTGNLVAALLVSLLVGAAAGLAFAVFTVSIKANQIIVGTALNLIGLGVTGFVFRSLFSQTVPSLATVFGPVDVPLLSQLPYLGEVLFRQSLLVYATALLVPLASLLLYRTAFGLSLRAVGDHPRAADTVGIDVDRQRYAATVLGAMLAALGGAYLSIAQTNVFVENMTAGRGFIALAAVVFGRWRPVGVLGASLLFGASYAL